MTLLLILTVTYPVLYFLMYFLEKRALGRKFEIHKNWKLFGFVSFLLVSIFSGIMSEILKFTNLNRFSLFDWSKFGFWAIIPAFLTLTFIQYWLHRAKHHYDILWRVFHQIHHSAKSVDILGAYVSHPFEMVLEIMVSNLIGVLLFNLSGETLLLYSIIAGFWGLFGHFNIATPQWLGFIIQRPEAHCLHHELGKHKANYHAFSLWDILFGTFENPKYFIGEVGFEGDKSNQISAMLKMKDVHKV